MHVVCRTQGHKSSETCQRVKVVARICMTQGPTASSNYRNRLAFTPTCQTNTARFPRVELPYIHTTVSGFCSHREFSPRPALPHAGPRCPRIAYPGNCRADVAVKMSDEVETPAQLRTSRFKEHTNTASSIKPPPDALWQDLGIEDMIEKFNEESRAPPVRKGAAAKATTPPTFGAPTVAASKSGAPTVVAALATPATNEGTFGRFSRAWTSVFGGFGSVLGKRKAGNADAEREREKEKNVLDERKQAADEAYAALKMAQEQGLLPTPKVFVRPSATPRTHKCGMLHLLGDERKGLTSTVAEHIAPATPRTPSLYKSPSKKDLQKQMKLSKRVSDLEHKLASARKELHTVLLNDVPPVPPLPAILPPAPTPETSQTTTTTTTTTSQIFSEADVSQDSSSSTPTPSQQPTPFKPSVGKIVKKRKATTTHDDDSTYIPVPTDSDGDISISASEPEQNRTIKRVKSQSNKRNKSSRLTKNRKKDSRMKNEEAVIVVPDGRKVPHVPKIPAEMEREGNVVRVRDDGYGGLGHEIF